MHDYEMRGSGKRETNVRVAQFGVSIWVANGRLSD